MTETQPVPVDPLAVTRAAALGLAAPVRVQLPLGTIDADVVADIDPSGLIQLRGAAWSLDWWIGAEDHPSLDAAVRQQSIGGAPMVETSMRVPGGDIVHRAYGARARSLDADGEEWSDSAVVVEIENLTSVPVALAVVIRPVTLDGPGRVSSVEADGPVIRVDGEVAAVLSKPVVRRSAGGPGDAARALHAGDDEPATAGSTSTDGSLEVAYVVPLPHATTVRMMLPRVDPTPRRGRPGARRSSISPGAQWEAPDVEAASSGWATHVRDLAAVELPEPVVSDVAAASEQTLMLAATDGFFEPGTGVTAAQRAEELCDALVRVGISQPLEPIVRALLDAQTLTGVVRMSDRSDATVALVHAATPLLTGSRSEFWAEELVGPVARAVHRLGRGKGLAPGSERSAAIALGRVAPALRAVDQPEVALAAVESSDGLYRRLASPAADAAGPDRGVVAAARALRGRLAAGDGASSEQTVLDVLSLLRTGLPGAVADVVGPDGNAGGLRGLDAAAVAARLGLLLDLLVGEGPDGPVLVPLWAPTWFGQACEAHRVRTRWGQVSFAVRWHGARPAVLWEIEPGPGVDPDAAPTLRAPGLDASWSASQWEGEALLSEVPVPEAVVSLSSRAAASIQPTTFSMPTSRSSEAPATPDEGQSFS